MSYARDEALPLPLPGSPSLLPNNLSLRPDGDRLAYVRLNEVICMNTTPGRIDHHRIAAPAKSQLCQAAFISVKGASYLVVTSSSGVYVWSDDGASMLFFLALSDVTTGDIEQQYMRGVASNETCLFVGTSLGQVLEICIPGSTNIEFKSTIIASKHPVSCMCTSSDFLLCADDTGDVYCFSAPATLSSSPLYAVTGNNYPCTSMVANSTSFIAGFSTGHIRAYKLTTGDLLVVVNAHIRCITGLALNHLENLLVSTSEDQFVNVWSVGDLTTKSAKSFSLLSPIKLENHLCTGVCFFRDGRIGVAAYDEEDVTVLQRTK